MLPRNSRYIGHEFEADITLVDAGTDPDASPTRRMIANASIGVGLEDAYYSVRELREAVAWVDNEDPRGRKRLSEILSNRCDDYQRCIYYCLAGRGIGNMLADLYWLELLLLARSRVGVQAARARYHVVETYGTYVAGAPDAVVPTFDPNFALGESWKREPWQRSFDG